MQRVPSGRLRLELPLAEFGVSLNEARGVFETPLARSIAGQKP